MTTPTQLPPSPAALAKATKYIAEKRDQITVQNTTAHARMNAMMAEIAADLGAMGVTAIQFGDEHIRLTDAAANAPALEAQWTSHINAGGFAAALRVTNDYTGYLDNEKVSMEERSISDLVDVARIKQLAPDAEIYAAPQAPWSDLIRAAGYVIWLNDRDQLDQLWADMPSWVKTDWHDTVLASSKFPRTFHSVATVTLTTQIAPDLTWRKARHDQDQARLDAADELGAWDSVAQQELKKAIGSLLQVEGHPVFGSSVDSVLATLAPMLAHSMSGKDRIKKLRKDVDASRTHLWAGFATTPVDWKDWTPQSPLPPAPSTKSATPKM